MKSDTQIQHDVLEEPNCDPSINAARIGVEVNQGVVTLAGHIDSFTEKWHAEQAAQRVSGVKALAVELEVILTGPNRRLDADIARSAENVLSSSSYIITNPISVMVEHGWITLTGSVNWDYQKAAIVRSVSTLMGVKGVSDQITINPVVHSGSVKTSIEAALRRYAKEGKHEISVQVDEADVTLSGIVRDWAQRDVASDTAWRTPGVRKVINNILIN
jgi:osmotically-inducible protein OsmY